MLLSITIVELFSCWFGVAEGWFDDPIGLSVRAYIFVPPIALGKSLLARPYLAPWIKLLPDPRAYASSPHWLLLSFTKPHSHAPLRYINGPAQHAYVSTPDWSPQSRCNLSPVLICQGHSSLDAPSELNPPQRIPSPLSYCTTSAAGRGLTVVLTCYSGRLFDVHVGRVDT